MRPPTRLAAAAAVSALLALAPSGRADDPARRAFDAEPSRPSALVDGTFAQETAARANPGSYRVELLLDYARSLLAYREGDRRTGDLLRDRLALHAIGGYAFGPLEVGVDLPIALYQRSDLGPLLAAGVTGPLVAPIASTALGDVRLVVKVPLLARPWLDVAVAADLRLPTGDEQSFLSDGLSVNPSVLVGRHLGPVRLDASVGYLFRDQGQFLQLVAKDGVTWGLGGSVPLPRAGKLETWRAIADVVGEWPRGDDFSTARHRAPVSARAGVRARLWRDLALDLGVGTGFGWFNSAGYGREAWRVFGGLRWEHLVSAAEANAPPQAPPPDRDGDGVPDAQDRCPDEPGPAELDGCPDRDGDQIPDVEDKCPDQPGPAQNDGCPLAPGTPVVELETNRLSLRDQINFDFDKDTLRPESGHILDEVAKILSAHPELKRIRVEGHTDNVGSRAYNLDLSHRRARRVVQALVQRGIAAGRLEYAGYGFDRPVATNATALGRAKNRRVEFTILAEEGASGTGAGR